MQVSPIGSENRHYNLRLIQRSVVESALGAETEAHPIFTSKATTLQRIILLKIYSVRNPERKSVTTWPARQPHSDCLPLCRSLKNPARQNRRRRILYAPSRIRGRGTSYKPSDIELRQTFKPLVWDNYGMDIPQEQ